MPADERATEQMNVEERQAEMNGAIEYWQLANIVRRGEQS